MTPWRRASLHSLVGEQGKPSAAISILALYLKKEPSKSIQSILGNAPQRRYLCCGALIQKRTFSWAYSFFDLQATTLDHKAG